MYTAYQMIETWFFNPCYINNIQRIIGYFYGAYLDFFFVITNFSFLK